MSQTEAFPNGLNEILRSGPKSLQAAGTSRLTNLEKILNLQLITEILHFYLTLGSRESQNKLWPTCLLDAVGAEGLEVDGQVNAGILGHWTGPGHHLGGQEVEKHMMVTAGRLKDCKQNT